MDGDLAQRPELRLGEDQVVPRRRPARCAGPGSPGAAGSARGRRPRGRRARVLSLAGGLGGGGADARGAEVELADDGVELAVDRCRGGSEGRAPEGALLARTTGSGDRRRGRAAAASAAARAGRREAAPAAPPTGGRWRPPAPRRRRRAPSRRGRGRFPRGPIRAPRARISPSSSAGATGTAAGGERVQVEPELRRRRRARRARRRRRVAAARAGPPGGRSRPAASDQAAAIRRARSCCEGASSTLPSAGPSGLISPDSRSSTVSTPARKWSTRSSMRSGARGEPLAAPQLDQPPVPQRRRRESGRSSGRSGRAARARLKVGERRPFARWPSPWAAAQRAAKPESSSTPAQSRRTSRSKAERPKRSRDHFQGWRRRHRGGRRLQGLRRFRTGLAPTSGVAIEGAAHHRQRGKEVALVGLLPVHGLPAHGTVTFGPS